MKLLSNIILILGWGVLHLSGQTYNWPCSPFDQQHFVNGTFCENRPDGSA
jgi:hypothetical protein